MTRKIKKRLMSAIAKLTILLMLLNFPMIGLTNSYFTDQSTIEHNIVSTGYWETPDEEPTPTPTITPTPSQTPIVIINEVMWMGSTESIADEWIELRNTTDQPVDIGQWTIDNTRHASGITKIMIPASSTIPASGYFLIGNYPETSDNSALNTGVDEVNNSIELLNSNNGNLILKDSNDNLIDQALGEVDWPAGINQTGSNAIHQSMERNNTPGDGLQPGSWHTCLAAGCTSDTFWDTPNTKNYGTPGAANLSSNDPTATDYQPGSTPPTVILNASEGSLTDVSTSNKLRDSSPAEPDQNDTVIVSTSSASLNPSPTPSATESAQAADLPLEEATSPVDNPIPTPTPTPIEITAIETTELTVEEPAENAEPTLDNPPAVLPEEATIPTPEDDPVTDTATLL